jgi:hypothetical protein
MCSGDLLKKRKYGIVVCYASERGKKTGLIMEFWALERRMHVDIFAM